MQIKYLNLRIVLVTILLSGCSSLHQQKSEPLRNLASPQELTFFQEYAEVISQNDQAALQNFLGSIEKRQESLNPSEMAFAYELLLFREFQNIENRFPMTAGGKISGIKIMQDLLDLDFSQWKNLPSAVGYLARRDQAPNERARPFRDEEDLSEFLRQLSRTLNQYTLRFKEFNEQQPALFSSDNVKFPSHFFCAPNCAAESSLVPARKILEHIYLLRFRLNLLCALKLKGLFKVLEQDPQFLAKTSFVEDDYVLIWRQPELLQGEKSSTIWLENSLQYLTMAQTIQDENWKAASDSYGPGGEFKSGLRNFFLRGKLDFKYYFPRKFNPSQRPIGWKSIEFIGIFANAENKLEAVDFSEQIKQLRKDIPGKLTFPLNMIFYAD